MVGHYTKALGARPCCARYGIRSATWLQPPGMSRASMSAGRVWFSDHLGLSKRFHTVSLEDPRAHHLEAHSASCWPLRSMSSMIWAAARVSRQKSGSVTMDTTHVTEHAAAARFVKQIFCTKCFTVPARTPLNSGRCCWLLIKQLRKPSQLSAEALQELTSNGGKQSCLCTEPIPLQFLRSTAQGVRSFCNAYHTKLL